MRKCAIGTPKTNFYAGSFNLNWSWMLILNAYINGIKDFFCVGS